MLQSQRTANIGVSGPILDLEKLRSTDRRTHPFDYVVVSNFIRHEWEDRLMAAFPRINKGGSFPLSTVKFGTDFSSLIDEMNGAEFRLAVEEKFSISLEGHPTMFTLRGRCRRAADGGIHTDSESKNYYRAALHESRDGLTKVGDCGFSRVLRASTISPRRFHLRSALY